MNFLKILRELKNSYGENVAYTDNGVCLLGPCPDARMAEHFIFAPMSHELM